MLSAILSFASAIVKPLAKAGEGIAKAKFRKDETVIAADKEKVLANIRRAIARDDLELRKEELVISQAENDEKRKHELEMSVAQGNQALDLINQKQNRTSFRDEYLAILATLWLAELGIVMVGDITGWYHHRPFILEYLATHEVWTLEDGRIINGAAVVMTLTAVVYMVIFGVRGMVERFMNRFGAAAGGTVAVVKNKFAKPKTAEVLPDVTPVVVGTERPSEMSGGGSSSDEPDDDEDIKSAKKKDDGNA